MSAADERPESAEAGRCAACGTAHVPGACPGAAGVRVGALLEGKYELVRLIGHGGMGEVYEGRHRVIGRRVAVKFLHGEYARHPDVGARFENEARAAGGSEHENIAGIYDIGALADGTRYLVMEFLDGEDVEKLARREGPLPPARAAFVAVQVCRALDVVHRRGIVHRDLKPSNLFLTVRPDGTDLVKVIDFGIAKLKTGDGRPGTRTGAAIGTAHYMSPEQARGERSIDARSDVYSLGVILYELLSGKRPHEGDSVLQILHKVMTQAPVPLETARPGLPEALYAIVRRAMAPVAAHRYAAAADFGEALLLFAGRPALPVQFEPTARVALAIDGDETWATPASAVGGAASASAAPLAGTGLGPSVSNPAAPPRGANAAPASGVPVAGVGLGGGPSVARRGPSAAPVANSAPAIDRRSDQGPALPPGSRHLSPSSRPPPGPSPGSSAPSFAGIARTEPNALGAAGARHGPRSGRRRPLVLGGLAGGGVLVGLAVLALRESPSLRSAMAGAPSGLMSERPLGLAAAPPLSASAPAPASSTPVALTTDKGGATTGAVSDASAPAPAASSSRRAGSDGARPPGRRDPPSEHGLEHSTGSLPRVSTPLATPPRLVPQAVAASASAVPADAPTPSPPATDRGDNPF